MTRTHPSSRPAGRPPRPLVQPLEPRQLFAAVPAGFTDEVFVSGLSSPTAMEFAPGGVLLVAQQTGELRLARNGQMLPNPAIALEVDSFGERGLLGVTVDSDFATNGFVYLHYTVPGPLGSASFNRVSRFTLIGDTIDPATEVVLLKIEPLSLATNHNGGTIKFGNDGKLYIGVGENGDRDLAQSLQTPKGKILRINRDGSIPDDNPFFNTTTGTNRATWALGLRNPFTFDFRDSDGKFFINDVGSNRFEEINVGTAGANYGWPVTEGKSTDARFQSPLYAYGRRDGGAIAGGVFYQAADLTIQGGVNPTGRFPSPFSDTYFFGDFSGDYIKALNPNTGTVTPFATDVGAPTNLDIGPDGALYYLSLSSGTVGRIGFVGIPPTLTRQPADVTTTAGKTAKFIAAARVTGRDRTLTYQWQRNGEDIAGATKPTLVITTTDADNGATYRVRVTSATASAFSRDAVLTVNPDQPPVPKISSPKSGTLFSAGKKITFSGTATDAEDGRLKPARLSWSVGYLPVGGGSAIAIPVIASLPGKSSGSFTIPATATTPVASTTTLTTAGIYRLTLTATDSAGHSISVTRDLAPRVVRLTVATTPPERLDAITFNGAPLTTPVFDSIVGVRHEFLAAGTLDDGGFAFVNWNGKSRKPLLKFTVPASAATLTANYLATPR